MYEYTPAEPKKPVLTFEDFGEHTAKILESHLLSIMGRDAAFDVTADINNLLIQIKTHEQRVEIFEGVFLHSVYLRYEPGERPRIIIDRIETDSELATTRAPSRHRVDTFAYLGKCEGMDAWIMFNSPYTPVLKVQVQPSVFESFTPPYDRPPLDHPRYQAIKEAIRRYQVVTGFIVLVTGQPELDVRQRW